MHSELQQLVLIALHDRAPEQEQSLRLRGELDAFVQETAQEVSSEINTRLQELRLRERWDDLPPMDLVRNLNTGRLQIREQVLAEMLELPASEQVQHGVSGDRPRGHEAPLSPEDRLGLKPLPAVGSRLMSEAEFKKLDAELAAREALRIEPGKLD